MRIVNFISFAAVFWSVSACEHEPILKSPPEVPAKLYVANSGDATVSVINTERNEVTETIDIGFSPSAMAVSSERKSVYVASYTSKRVVVIDAETDVIKNTIVLPGHPCHLAVGDDMAYIIVDPDSTVFNDAYIGGIKLDQSTFADSLYFDGKCNSLEYLVCDKNGTLYGASELFPTCYGAPPFWPLIINTKTAMVISRCGISLGILKLSPNEKLLYLVDSYLECLSTFDIEAKKITLTTPLKTRLAAITLSSTGRQAYIADEAGNYLFEFNLAQHAYEDSIKVNAPVNDAVVTRDDRIIYASHSSTNTVAVVDIKTKTVGKEVPVGEKPDALTLFPPPY